MSNPLDALDMVINVLNEHEKKIDELIERLEKAIEIIERDYDARKKQQKMFP